jgi:hypothetical protein
MAEPYTHDTKLPPCLDEPCNECPFLRSSVAGYLGGHVTAEGWVEIAHGEEPLICHKTIQHGEHEWTDPKLRQCRGGAIFRRNIHKTPRNLTAALGPRDTDRVFSWDDEFIAHHTHSVLIDRRRRGAAPSGSVEEQQRAILNYVEANGLDFPSFEDED